MSMQLQKQLALVKRGSTEIIFFSTMLIAIGLHNRFGDFKEDKIPPNISLESFQWLWNQHFILDQLLQKAILEYIGTSRYETIVIPIRVSDAKEALDQIIIKCASLDIFYGSH